MGNRCNQTAKPHNRIVEVSESILLNNYHFSFKNEDIHTRLQGHSWTYLHLAVWNRKKSIVKSMIEFGFDTDIQDDHGETPLHIAAVQRDCELYKLLLDAGALENIPNKAGKTPHDYLEEKGMGIITQTPGDNVVTVKLENNVSRRTELDDSCFINEW
ncbi:unnamed protein product [Blepharisma stoltei]|uniref:Ankyrin repeat protein n=1 Tax=Blepharisma stoltei TaxID=1481888 RepID=A0AAU9ILH0_9CILI|nr:unnamed protein product [Blepharisma stoltei]